MYDSANQLVRENNQSEGYTHVWTYDKAGNILSHTKYAYTTDVLGSALETVSYTYGDSQWGDLLTGYGDRTITSDAIGNTLSDGKRTYTWEHGRQLATLTQDGVTWTNTYNADGLRTKRTDGTNTYEYVYHGGLLQYMEYNDTPVWFTYAPDGTPISMTTGGQTYYYITNYQGDVVGLVDQTGGYTAYYDYDAWGYSGSIYSQTVPLSVSRLNPLRYRGYVYDVETGLYYLQSRYYDPEIGRFINHDTVYDYDAGHQGFNLFVYCGNNPISRIDISGADSELLDVDDADDQFEPILEGSSSNGYPSSPYTSSKISYTTAGSYSKGTGYSSYSAYKRAHGSAGSGYEWHHIVEQSQISRSGFAPDQIHNTSNIIKLTVSQHRAISAYYSRTAPFAAGKSIRDWLSGQSFNYQYEFGMNEIQKLLSGGK